MCRKRRIFFHCPNLACLKNGDCIMQNIESDHFPELFRKAPLALRKQKTQADSCIRVFRELLKSRQEKGTPADVFLNSFFRMNRQFGSRDRRVITECIFIFFRWEGWIRKVLKMLPYTKLDSESVLIWQMLAGLAAEGRSVQGISSVWCETVGLDPDCIERIEREEIVSERRFQRFVQESMHVLSVEESAAEEILSSSFRERDLVPAWAEEEIAPECRNEFFQMLQKRPPLWLRIQRSSAREEVRKAVLACSDAVKAEYHPLNPDALKVEGARIHLQELDVWQSGKLEVQDFSSQCIGLAAMPGKGEIWWDVCAGGGGKTLELASMMDGSGCVFAGDIRFYKLQEVQRRSCRAGFQNIRLVRYPAQIPSLKEGTLCDGVLVDAPCSSSGRWRRNPDARFLLAKERVGELCTLQKNLLNQVCRFVRPGGVLVYGTCSVFKRENEGTVEAFLKEHPEFVLEAFRNPHTGESCSSGMLQTLPASADCDGSFVCRFRRRK